MVFLELAYPWALGGYYVAGVLTGLALLRIDAPYGRLARSGWGPEVPARWAWMGMESPAIFAMLALFLAFGPSGVVPWAMLALWLLHYGQRTFVYPLLVRGRPVPLTVAALAFGFNLFNAWMQAGWIATTAYDATWLRDPRFVLGVALFLVGFVVNVRSDAILRGLRARGERGYRIPHGFLYRWVSCPNYLGEMLEWFGWALLTWSPAGLAFALYTVANLGPRALASHRWYRETFPDYPPDRRALVPYVI